MNDRSWRKADTDVVSKVDQFSLRLGELPKTARDGVKLHDRYSRDTGTNSHNDLMDWELGQNPRLGSLPAQTDTRHPALRMSDGCAYRRFAIAALKDDVTGKAVYS